MKWIELYLGGQKWGVYLVNPTSKRLKGDPDETVTGHTYFDECRIYLDRTQSEQALQDTLIHELLHATLAVSGASHTIGSAKKEEDIVRDLTPIWHRLLKDMGLVFPKR